VIVERIANDLGLPPEYITNLARGASYEYKEYKIAKRTGGYRVIHHPSRRLKALQRWLLQNVIHSFPVHTSASAYRQGQSIFDNAKVHAKSRYLLRMDLKDFFPSITEQDLRNYISHHAGLFSSWTVPDIDAFCGLVCRRQVLTIGAPTSPALSNAICHDLDVSLHALSDTMGVRYTRYADDLFFSTYEPNVLKQIEKEVSSIVSNLSVPGKLTVNTNKTRHSSKRRARHVTGIVLGSDGRPHIGRTLKRQIRALIHKSGHLDGSSRASLAGMIAYAEGFDPDFINSLITKYGLPTIRNAMIRKNDLGSSHLSDTN
jgi:RNA-directed DNA polymerase